MAGITAGFDKDGAIRVNTLIKGTCSNVEYGAILDSGFNGDLAIPIDIAVEIGLELGGVTTIVLADGSTEEYRLFLCNVMIGTITQAASVLVIGDDVLIGTGLMEPFDVCFRKATSEVIIEPQGSYAGFVGMMNNMIRGE